MRILSLSIDTKRIFKWVFNCKVTYVYKKDDGHDPGEVVRENLEQALEHALVVDDVPEKFLLLFF
jgi:hypothetical protein